MRRVRMVAVLVALAVAGCGPKGPVRGVVRGRVTLGSAPVSGAVVSFEGVEPGTGVNAPLGPDGSYEVRTYQGDGLPAGAYKVSVRPGGVMTPDEQGPKATEAKAARPKPSVVIPAKYHTPATSGLRIDVKEGDNPPFDFELTPDK